MYFNKYVCPRKIRSDVNEFLECHIEKVSSDGSKARGGNCDTRLDKNAVQVKRKGINMQIQPVFLVHKSQILKKNNNDNISPLHSNPIHTKVLPNFAYRDYNISFGERLHRTPENFYEQKFNIENMPVTVKKYLFEDFDERHHMPPAQLQRQAFEYLKIADSVQEIKDMYPDEPLFSKLKEAKDTKPSSGILLLLKWDAQTFNTPIFKDKENKELTTYLLKKVYLEGKTIDELNKDFDKDATEEIKKELGVKDGKYFSPSTIRTLGIRYPNLAYYNSFLATRDDKEYIPPVRKSGVKVSEETKEKLSASMTKWWSGLNEMERAEQIQKMLNGKEMSDSIFFKYQGQIMTIASAKIGFSERLSEVFADKYSDENFQIDFPTFSEQQREIMLEFWNKDPEFRTQYSEALQSVISDFEIAYYSEDKAMLESLLNKALDLKEKILNKAREKRYYKKEMSKLAQPAAPKTQQTPLQLTTIRSKDIFKLFREYELESMKFFTEDYRKAKLEFLTNNLAFKDKQNLVMLNQPNAQQLLNLNDADFEKLQNQMAEKTKELDKKFYRNNPVIENTNAFVLNNFIYKLTGNPGVYNMKNDDILNAIKTFNWENQFLKNMPELNSEMKELLKEQSKFKAKFNDNQSFPAGSAANDIKKYINSGFIAEKNRTVKENFEQLGVEDDLKEDVKHILTDYVVPANELRNFLLQNYAVVKFITDHKNDEQARKGAFNLLVSNYMGLVIHLMETAPEKLLAKNNNYIIPSANPAQNIVPKQEQKSDIPSGIKDIDINSPKEVNKLFKKQILDSMPFFTDIYKQEFIKFMAENTSFKQKRELVALWQPDAADLLNLSEAEFVKLEKEALGYTTKLNDSFAAKYPAIVKTNDFLLDKILYEITENPAVYTFRADSVYSYVLEHNLEDEIKKYMPQINNEMKKLAVTSSKKPVEDFYNLYFKPELDKILNSDIVFKYYPEYNGAAIFDIRNLIKLNEKNNDNIYNFLKNYNAAIKYFNTTKADDSAKQVILEHIIADYLGLLQKNLKSQPNLEGGKDLDLDADYNVNLKSMSSLREGIKRYYHQTETKYWADEPEKEFLDFLARYDGLSSEGVSAFMMVKSNGMKNYWPDATSKDKRTANVIAETINIMLHDNFETDDPLMANANNAALNLALYEITRKPEALAVASHKTADFIKNNFLDKKLYEKKPQIIQSYKQYLEPLPVKDIQQFYNTKFYPEIIKVFESGLKYQQVKSSERFRLTQEYIIDAIKTNNEEIKGQIHKYLMDKNAFIRLMNDASISDIAKDMLLEKLVVDFEFNVSKDINQKFK